jgi:serine protease AprX
MMRYAIVSKGLSLSQMEAEAVKVGAKDIRVAKLLNQLFCELDERQAEQLSQTPGMVVKPIKEYKTDQMVTALPAAEMVETLWDVFFLLRSYFTPPLTGTGLTVAVLDSGIHKSHESLRDKVVYEGNFTESPTPDDIFGHGTQVAFVAAGGIHAPKQKTGVSPGAKVLNIKVIDDEGNGTDESIVLGIDKVCELVETAQKNGLWVTDGMYPNIINISLGGEDDGDSNNPLRAACRQASRDYGLDVIAAAGNSGPKMTTIMLPACEPEAIAVGATETTGELTIWEKSSRGPTLEGETKPDFVLWGTNIEMASHKADDEYLTKSGTSFSTPILSGLTGLIWESGRRAYGESWPFRWVSAREFAPYFCLKPQAAPLKKDNTYGFGFPAMGTLIGSVAGIGASGAGIADMATGLLSIGLLGMMMTTVGGIRP